MVNWYLLQTKPNAHVTASENLRRQGFDVFLPLIIKTTKKNGKFLDKKVPLFPGYLFMGTLINLIPWKSVTATRGVSSAVTLDGMFRSVNTSIIKNLQHRCDEQSVFQSLRDIDVGDRVKIERGPFADFICTVEKIKDYQRAWVLMSILQQKTKSEISLNNLSKIN